MAHEHSPDPPGEPPETVNPEETEGTHSGLGEQIGTFFGSAGRVLISLPWTKSPGPLAVLGIIGTIGWSHWQDDHEIPKLFHSNILMTEEALALSLQRGRQSPPSALNEQVSLEISHQLRQNSETKSYLLHVATSHSVRTYVGSRTYVRHEVPLFSLRCLMLSDPDIRQLIARTTQDIQDCTDAEARKVSVLLPFVDLSPLVIPFVAKPGDDVVLSIYVDSHNIGKFGEETSVKYGHKLAQAHTYPKTPVKFNKVSRSNYLSANIDVPEEVADQFISISLNEQGRNMVDASGAMGRGGDEPYVISLFSTVTVTPSWKEASQ